MVHRILKRLTNKPHSHDLGGTSVRFSLLSLLIKFTRDLTAQEARKSQDGGIRFGRKTGRCISIGPFFRHCGRVQALKYAQLLEP